MLENAGAVVYTPRERDTQKNEKGGIRYMELEELKKSWNALDEHLKDKELIKRCV